MRRLTVTTAAIFLLFTLFAHAGELSLSGRVVDEKGGPLAGASIDLNGQLVTTDQDGAFKVTAGEAGLYTLRYSAEDYFPVIHSYSSLELSWSGSDGKHKVPDVTLVKRQARPRDDGLWR